MAAHLAPEAVAGLIESAPRRRIADEAREWLGVRFQHQGRTDAGLDCAGLVIVVGKALGALPEDLDVTAYARRPDGRSLVEHCREHLQPIALSRLTVGDVAVFRIESDPQHLAIVGEHPSGGFSMIHAYAPSRKVVENRMDTVWQSRLVAAFRYRLPGAA
jgi:cell wall-associated NlpC family hydrolase